MKVVLFIGHHKVGSTSLQDFLSRNAVALARAGILYPSVDSEGMALMMATAISGQVPDGVLPINAREPHNALAFRMLASKGKGKVPPYHKGLPAVSQMTRAIRKQVAFLNPHTVILAAEVFANFAPASPDLIAELAAIFPKADFTVLATLRRIDTYLASWHGQRLKFGHKPPPLRENGLQGYFGNIHFNYRLMLEGWIKALPKAQIILRDYSAVRAAGGSIADLVAQTGLDLPPDLLPEQRVNESIHRAMYEIARQGNKALPPAQATELRQFLRWVTPELDLPPSGDIELFGPENRQIMAERFAPIHDYLSKISGTEQFFTDQQDVAKLLPVSEQDAMAMALEGVIRHKDDLDNANISDFLVNLNPNFANSADTKASI
jgi:hypothetical protein